jgi:hypothetical protein
MDDVHHRPESLSDGKLDGAIAWLAERGRDAEAANFRREKLRRQFLLALNERMKADPTLGNTSTVTVT